MPESEIEGSKSFTALLTHNGSAGICQHMEAFPAKFVMQKKGIHFRSDLWNKYAVMYADYTLHVKRSIKAVKLISPITK